MNKITVTAYLYPDPVMTLNTFYNLSRDGITITGKSTAGSSAIFPYDLSSSSQIDVAVADVRDDRAKASADHTLTGMGIDGTGLIVLYYGLRTELKLNYVDAQYVDFNIYQYVDR